MCSAGLLGLLRFCADCRSYAKHMLLFLQSRCGGCGLDCCRPRYRACVESESVTRACASSQAVKGYSMCKLQTSTGEVVPSKRAPLLDESQAAQRAAERECHFFQAVAKGFSFIQDKWNQMIASVCVCHVSILLRGYLQPL